MVVKIPKMKDDNNLGYDVLIIIFTRFPEAGKVKTRLIPTLGPKGAADLQKQMTEFTVGQAEATGHPLQIRYTGGTEEQMRNWLGTQHEYVSQSQGDLGARMSKACEDAFNAGAKKVILIGSDCPDNRTENMLKAIQLLDTTSCVLGPAFDGGYYLIGLAELKAELFCGIDWGRASVLHQTIERTRDYKLLQTLNDVDNHWDLQERISVVIPTLNEERNIESTIRQALRGFNTEAIVVDGGSSDRTREMASAEGAMVISNPPGRACQMNAGARQATGDILLFLHADSILPTTWDLHVRRMMKRSGVSLGFFRFAIAGDFAGRKWVELGTNIRALLFKHPYGDQGMFLRKKDFEDLGAFPEIPILEDAMLLKKAKRKGKICCTDAVLFTSGRRWKNLGFIRTTLVNQAVLLGAWFGADLNNLSQAYHQGVTPLFINSKTKRYK